MAYLANPTPGFVLVISLPDEATGVDPNKLRLEFLPTFSVPDSLFVADFDGVTGFESPAPLGGLLWVVCKNFGCSFCPDIPGGVFAPSEASALEGFEERVVSPESG
jgi:hypothetical protein